MDLDPKLLAEFRERLQQARDANRDAWDSSTRLVGRSALPATVKQLREAIISSTVAEPVRQALVRCLDESTEGRPGPASAEQLKQLTGLQPNKALRSLCVLFGLGGKPSEPISSMTPEEIEQWVRAHPNPYDLLIDAQVASLLDLGAGDLSFGAELVEQYLPRLSGAERELVLHCVERLAPDSRLGSVLHADASALSHLKQASRQDGLRFRFWGGVDMFGLDKADGLWPAYTIVTCHAPATPAFAYEPSRLSEAVISSHLRKTKGEFRTVRVDGEEALEVQHGGRSLLFPPWKFEIRGPLALLDLVSRRGKLCILSSVDTDVFWELLSQLLAKDRFRPPDVIFSEETRAQVFGSLYATLCNVPAGQAVDLATQTPLRDALPRVLPAGELDLPPLRFRYVELRRGAVFEGLPASRTARVFKDLPEEAPPWFLLLVPE